MKAPDNMCTKVLADIHDALGEMDSSDIFKGIQDMPPLEIGAGGTQATFNQKDMERVLGASGAHNYKASGNFMWQSFTWLANHRVPVNMGQVRELHRFTFKHDDPPNELGFDIVIALESATTKVMEHKGALHRISTPEPVIAVLLAIAKAVRDGNDEEILMRWRKIILTSSFQFEVVAPGEDRFWRAQNIRQSLIETLARRLDCTG